MWRMENQEVEDFGLKPCSESAGVGTRTKSPSEKMAQLSPPPITRSRLFLAHFRASFPSHLRSTRFSCWPGQPRASALTEPTGAQRSTGAAAAATELVPTAPVR